MLGGDAVPLYTCDVQKTQGGEYWTNRYVIEAGTIFEAQAQADLIPGAEQLFHTTNVTLDRYRVRPLTPGGDQYIIVALGASGAYNGGALDTQLPLFNCVRADLPVNLGRPSRKYYRTGLTEGMVAGPQLENAYRTVVDNALEGLRNTMAGSWVDPDAQTILSVSVIPFVAMRQLRRGSRRRTEPII